MPASLARDVDLNPLTTEGYAWLQSVGAAGFNALSQVLGRPLRQTHVRLDPIKGTYLTSPGSIPLHTDHPAVPWIAWLCVEQDADDGALVLADLEGVPADMRPDASVTAACPCLDSTRARTVHPVLQRGQWYFPDWHLRGRPECEALVAAVDRLPRIEIPLVPGDVLVIDNRRMLHGRRSLPPKSHRHLIRHWYADAQPAGCQCVNDGPRRP